MLFSLFSLAMVPGRGRAPDKLDRANLCPLLPAKPAAVQLLPRGLTAHAEPGHVLIQLDDNAVHAPAGVAMSEPCRTLVSELGTVRALESSCTPLRNWQLQRAFRPAAPPLAAAASDAADAMASAGSCEVLFTRRPLLDRLRASCVGLALCLPGVPRAARLAARAGRAQLTPTSGPTPVLRLLRRLPWRFQRLAARAWVQSMLQEVPPRTRRGGEGEPQGQPAHAQVHGLERIFVLPMLSASQCKEAIQEAEQCAGASRLWIRVRGRVRGRVSG